MNVVGGSVSLRGRDLISAADLDAREVARLFERQEAELAARNAQPPTVITQTIPAPAANIPSRTGFEGIGGIETQKSADRITVRVPGDVLFEPGKADLRSTSIKTLDQVIAVIDARCSAIASSR